MSTLGLSPLLALPLYKYAPLALAAAAAPPLRLAMPAVPPEFLAGLALVLCVPTTLSTGVILTKQANANAALTLLLVVITNVLGVFTIPYALEAVFGAAASVTLDPQPLLLGLAKTILAPLAAGIAARALVPGLARAVDATRGLSRLLQQACLVATPWMTVCDALLRCLLCPAAADAWCARCARR